MDKQRSKRGPTRLQETFPPACAAAFDALLASSGFARGATKTEPDYCSQQYIAGERYVEISANLEPMDAPYCCNLVLGEGRTDWPERDWNAIGLWRLVRYRMPEQAAGGILPLTGQVRVREELGPALERMRDDLVRFGSDFLAGDPETFRQVRAAQARERKSYTIHTPDGQGDYVPAADPVSAALRERVSREGGG